MIDAFSGRSKVLPILFALWLASPAYAIDVLNLYLGSCQVVSGVLVQVLSKEITVLKVDGRMQTVPKYQVVAIAAYPLPGFPVQTIEANNVPYFDFTTHDHGITVPLAAGWPIEYSETDIQLLGLDGKDLLVPRQAIWGLRIRTLDQNAKIGDAATNVHYKLRNPLVFESCPDAHIGNNALPALPIAPQKTWLDPVQLRGHQDRLEQEYKVLMDYEDRQRFYAYPHYFGNFTRIGTTAIMGSRYTNIGARQTNFLPLVEDELNTGPFRLQRRVRSGVAPIPWSVHDEPILQAFYGLKADYIHLEMFLDPMFVLLRSKYDWTKQQLKSYDDRVIEPSGFEFGIDVGPYSLYGVSTSVRHGFRAKERFRNLSENLGSFGLVYRHDLVDLRYYSGSSETIRHQKVVGLWRLWKNWSLETIGILRRSNFHHKPRVDYYGNSDPNDLAWTYVGEARTLAAQVNWQATYRWLVQVRVGLESVTGETSLLEAGSKTRLYPKLDLGGGLTF